MTEVFRATEAFAFTGDSGVPRLINPGDLVTSDDPDYKGREHLFEPAVNAANRAAETASAAPGERRSRVSPRTNKISPAPKPDQENDDEPEGATDA